jgi:hypothetical protein
VPKVSAIGVFFFRSHPESCDVEVLFVLNSCGLECNRRKDFTVRSYPVEANTQVAPLLLAIMREREE